MTNPDRYYDVYLYRIPETDRWILVKNVPTNSLTHLIHYWLDLNSINDFFVTWSGERPFISENNDITETTLAELEGVTKWW